MYADHADFLSVGVQIVGKSLLAGRRMLRVMSVHDFHQLQVFSTLTAFLVIEAASVDLHPFAESFSTNACGALLFQLDYLTLSPASSQACAKKSHSSVSCPTLRMKRSFRLSVA